MAGMLAYVPGGGRGATDALLARVAAALGARGLRLAGAVQLNRERPGAARCEMELHVLAGACRVPISQSLGALSRGCRLDPGGLERAVGLVEASLRSGEWPDLLIVNKFGKQEAEGRGFRPVIGSAVAEGLPVLTAVAPGQHEAFVRFAGGLAEPLPPEFDAVLGWAVRAAEGRRRLRAASGQAGGAAPVGPEGAPGGVAGGVPAGEGQSAGSGKS